MGWILVFDMDQTITGDYFNVLKEPKREIDINPMCLDILREAVKGKQTGETSAIFLLTNNSDRLYIKKMHNTLKEKLDIKSDIFDYIMDANHRMRNSLSRHPNHKEKSIQDIQWMCTMTNTLGSYRQNLLERVIFFDDQDQHTLVNQLRKAGFHNNFVHINPPYQTPRRKPIKYNKTKKSMTRKKPATKRKHK